MKGRDGIPPNNLEGEALWEEIIRSVERDEQLKLEVKEAIEEGKKSFHHISLQQEGIIHPSSKKDGALQFTYFDKYGAIGDLEAKNVKEMTDKLFDLGFSLCEEEDFQYTLLADDKNKKVNKKTIQAIEMEM